MQKKTKSIFILVAIAILAVAAFSSGFKFQVTGDTKPTLEGMVNLPNFASAKCQAGAIGTIATFDMANAYEVPNAPYGTYQMYKEFGCDKNTKECIFNYKVARTIGELWIYKVPITTKITTYSDFANLNKVVANIGYVSGNDQFAEADKYNFNSDYYTPTEKIIVRASDVPLGGFLDAGDLLIRVDAQQFDLDSTTDRGLRNVALNTCDLSKIHTSGERDVLEKDFLSGITNGDVKKTTTGKYVVPFERAVSYIASLSPVSETQDIIERNNAWVWVMQPKTVCPIEKSPAEFGSIKYYADCRVPITASEIVCMPSTPNCKPDGTGYLTTEDPKTCNFYGGGLPVGYYPDYISGDYNKYCKFTCESGVVKTNSCVTLKNCDVGYKFSFEKNTCVQMGSTDLPNLGGDSDYTWLLIAGAVVLGLMILTSTAVLSGKKKR